jgi:hypothetical protein
VQKYRPLPNPPLALRVACGSELARDSCGCRRDCMKNREQARSHKEGRSSALRSDQASSLPQNRHPQHPRSTPRERLLVTVVDFRSVIQRNVTSSSEVVG